MANNSEDGDVIILLLPVWLSVGLAESKERAKKKKKAAAPRSTDDAANGGARLVNTSTAATVDAQWTTNSPLSDPDVVAGCPLSVPWLFQVFVRDCDVRAAPRRLPVVVMVVKDSCYLGYMIRHPFHKFNTLL